jgi:hypothetical protein
MYTQDDLNQGKVLAYRQGFKHAVGGSYIETDNEHYKRGYKEGREALGKGLAQFCKDHQVDDVIAVLRELLET